MALRPRFTKDVPFRLVERTAKNTETHAKKSVCRFAKTVLNIKYKNIKKEKMFMKQRTKWITALSCILTLSALLFCFSLVNINSTYATTGTTDYTVVKDADGAELGVL